MGNGEKPTDVVLKSKTTTPTDFSLVNNQQIANERIKQTKENSLKGTLEKLIVDKNYMKTMPEPEWKILKEAIAKKGGVDIKNIKGIGISSKDSNRFQVQLQDGIEKTVDFNDQAEKKNENPLQEILKSKLDTIDDANSILKICSMTLEYDPSQSDFLDKYISDRASKALEVGDIGLGQQLLEIRKLLEYQKFSS